MLRKYAIFRKVAYPGSNPDAWADLLDAALPLQFRAENSSPPAVGLDAVDVAELLLAAQYPETSIFSTKGIDVLYHLSINQGRWDAVVWLAKKLVESFPTPRTHDGRFSWMTRRFSPSSTLDDLTTSSIKLKAAEAMLPTDSIGGPSLNEMTGSVVDDVYRSEQLRHHAFGQLWRSLGAMTQACTGGEIRPEILEIIAFLHHHEVMPHSIYEYNPHSDKSAIGQSPLLALLSSRILTSLSDAAWRAHERLVLEEAKTKGGEYVALRPEIPGSVYRVNVAGLRPEVWMELILWACVHGGWIFEGLAVVRALSAEKDTRMWKPLSLRKYENKTGSSVQNQSTDWDQWDYIFKTRAISAMEASDVPTQPVERTVSAEVVNAYIDALVSTLNIGVGARGTEIEPITAQLHALKNFLGRSKLSLSSGSWDALLLRLVESQSISPERDSNALRNLISLSPGIGQGLDSANTRDLPAYVFDGNAAIQGLLHRSLLGQIAAGSLEGSLAVFKSLQQRSDADKLKSLVNFMNGRSSSLLHASEKRGMFTSNFSGIEYPTFDLQIPPVILGRFLDLVTEAKAYEFGKWLLYSNDVDGPVISKHLYRDPHIQPALIRFAAETNDAKTLSGFKGQTLSLDVLRSMLDNRVNSRQWDSTIQVLKHLNDMHTMTWKVANLANLARAMLLEFGGDSQNSTSRDNSLKARSIFEDMVRGRFDRKRPLPKLLSVQSMLIILSAVDAEWAQFCIPLHMTKGHVSFTLGTTAFNMILDGVAGAYGSTTAQRILDTFWPHSVRTSHNAIGKANPKRVGRVQMSHFRPDLLKSVERQRIVVQVPGKSGGEFVVLGGLEPTTATIMIVIRKALEELSSSSELISKDATWQTDPMIGDKHTVQKHNIEQLDEQKDHLSRKVLIWALHRLLELPFVDEEVLQQLEDTLSERGMHDVPTEVPNLFKQVEEEASEFTENEYVEHIGRNF